MTNRRQFLLGAAAVIATPAIVRAESLMRVVAPKLIVPMSATEVVLRQSIAAEDLLALMEERRAAFLDAMSKTIEQTLFYGNSMFETNHDGLVFTYSQVDRALLEA